MIILSILPVAVGKQLRRVPHNMLNKRFHWAVRNRWNNAWKEAVGWVWMSARPRSLKLPLKFAKIQVFLSVVRFFDYDGSYSAAKPLVDGLTQAGVIIDDSPKYIDLEVKQEKVKHRKDEGVVIKVIPTPLLTK